MEFLGELGTVIPTNSDLDDYLTPGKYYVTSAANSATIANNPYTSGGFSLYVLQQGGSSAKYQFFTGNRSGEGFMAYRYYDTSNWGDWILPATTSNLVQMMDAGSVSFGTVASGAYADVDVTFNKTFPENPYIIAMLSTSTTTLNYGGSVITSLNRSTTGCTLRFLNNSGGSLGSPSCHWIAVLP